MDPSTIPTPPTAWETQSPADVASASDGAETVEHTQAPENGSQAPQSARRPRIGVTVTRDLVKRAEMAEKRAQGFLDAVEKLGITPDTTGLVGMRETLRLSTMNMVSALGHIEAVLELANEVNDTVESL